MTPAGLAGADAAAFAAWFAGSRIVADGAPLICYHGTSADFSVFMAHAPVTVYRLDGTPIDRVDSWDVAGDWRRRPEAFHYGALTDAVQLGAEAALAMREREAQAMASYRRARGDATPAADDPADDPADDTLRRLTDLRRLVGRALVQTTEVRPSGDGHYFTPDPGYSFIRDIGRRDAGRVLPVYLAIRNPVYLNAAQIESAGSAHWVAHYRALGHDGAIFSDYADLRRRGWNGATQIVAFDAHQIKSVFNVGTYDPANPDIRFRRDSAQPLPAPAGPSPTPVAPNPFTSGLGSAALARHGVAISAARRAAAFAAWFKASHVRHADGTPRICYHGSTADFSEFRAHRGTDADPGWYGSGIYLTADPATASAYAGELAETGAGQPARAPRVIAAYVSLQRPYVWPPGRAAATTPDEARAIRAELEAAGYDGVVVPNPYAEPELAAHWEVVAFHPAQVKSAYNVGTFDPANDDIRYARSTHRLPPEAGGGSAPAVDALAEVGTLRTQTAAFREWFGASRVVKDGAPQVVYHGTSADLARFDLGRAGEHSEATGAVAFFTSSPRVASGYAVHLDRNAEMVALLDEARALRDRWAAAGAAHGADSAAYRTAEAAYWAVAQRRDALSAAIHDFAAPTTGASVVAAYLALANPLELDAGGQPARKDGLMAKAIAQAQHEGRDGVIVRNVLDYATPATREVADVFVVFDAAAVKAVYGNSGAYARANDDLRFARAAGTTLPAAEEAGVEEAGVEEAVRRAAGTPVPRKEGPLRGDAFDAWFGASKVVDAQGMPRVVYHGTGIEKNQFRREGGGSGVGAYFTPDPAIAKDYAEMDVVDDEDTPTVIAVYLSLQNPFHMDGGLSQAISAQRRDELEALGYDGVIGHLSDGEEYVAFRPEQIKSVFNTGSFDKANPDIRFARDAARTLTQPDPGKTAPFQDAARDAAFAAWFAGSTIVDTTGAPLVLYHGTKSDFTAYDIKSFGASDEGLLGRGFYFTYNPEEASSYALNEQYGKGDAPNVQPVYVSITNPFVICQGRLPDGRTVQDLHKGTGVTASGGRAVRQLAEEGGHDGIVWASRDGRILHVVAWRPEQIKSAIGNTGTYDAENADIRFARSAAMRLPRVQQHPFNHNVAGNHNVANLADKQNMAAMPRGRAERDCYEP